MKVKILLSFCLAAAWFQPGITLAQDSTRVPEVSADPRAAVDPSVDASSHAGIDEQQSQQAQDQAGNQPKKRKQNSQTKWAPQPATAQASATRFQPTQSNKQGSQTDRNADSNALFNPLTRDVAPRVAPSDDQSKVGQNHADGTSADGSQSKQGTREELDPQSAARKQMLDSLNTNATAASSGRPWNSPISGSAHTNKSTTSTSRKKSAPPAQNPFSKPGDSKLNSLKSTSQKRKATDPAPDGKPKSLLDSNTLRN